MALMPTHSVVTGGSTLTCSSGATAWRVIGFFWGCLFWGTFCGADLVVTTFLASPFWVGDFFATIFFFGTGLAVFLVATLTTVFFIEAVVFIAFFWVGGFLAAAFFLGVATLLDAGLRV